MPEPRRRSFAQRHPVVATVGAILVLVFAVSAITGGGSKPGTNPATTDAKTSSTNASSSASSASSSASSTPATATAAATSTSTRTSCGDITTNTDTSCPFARNVKAAYDANPGSTVQASSPVTGLVYTMTCSQAGSTVTCTGGHNARLSFLSAAGNGTGTVSSTTTPVAVEGPESPSHATDAQFCKMYSCIPNFSNGNGTIVQCRDGQWSHSGGLSGACSDHGGEK